MLIDDSSTNNILYESILVDEGYDVVIFEDAKKAINHLKNEVPDLIMLDLMMPGMDGFNFLENKNTLENAKNIPVVMLTAKTEKDSEKKAYELGVAEYLIKPVGIAEITSMVKKILV
jgi:DNA-binding response OmpR family regulator